MMSSTIGTPTTVIPTFHRAEDFLVVLSTLQVTGRFTRKIFSSSINQKLGGYLQNIVSLSFR
jgi:hypothetical protein